MTLKGNKITCEKKFSMSSNLFNLTNDVALQKYTHPTHLFAPGTQLEAAVERAQRRSKRQLRLVA
jgi:hypothetical protein